MGEFVTANMEAFVAFVVSLPNFLAAMVVSIICGTLIGLERESRGKPAGVRTLVLICLGSAIFVQISMMLAGNFGDPARIAAQIVSGIGFLGAGAIIQQSERGYIAGLTTAASIWVTAAVGMIVGAEKYFFALISTAVVVISLRLLRQMEKHLFYHRHVEKKEVIFDANKGKTEWKIMGLIEDHMMDPDEYEFIFPENKSKPRLRLTYCKTNRNHRSFLTDLARMKEVEDIHKVEASAKA